MGVQKCEDLDALLSLAWEGEVWSATGSTGIKVNPDTFGVIMPFCAWKVSHFWQFFCISQFKDIL